MSLTAAHCAKTLVMASAAGNAMLLHCARLLIPGLIEYVAKMAPLVNDASISEPQVTAVGEVWKAFSAFFSSVPDNHRKPTYYIHQFIFLISPHRRTPFGCHTPYHRTIAIELSNISDTCYDANYLSATFVCDIIASSFQRRSCETG